MKTKWSLFIKVLMRLVILAIVVFSFSSCALQQVTPGSAFIDDYKIKDSSVFFISTEVIVDSSLIIPAGTVGTRREMCPGEWGINFFVFDFLAQNGQEVSLRFVRKALLEKKPTNPRNFILKDEAEFYQGENYRAKKTRKPLNLKQGTEYTLLFNQRLKK